VVVVEDRASNYAGCLPVSAEAGDEV